MQTKKRLTWVIVFLVFIVLMATLAASWNVALYQQYERSLGLLRELARNEGIADLKSALTWTTVLGWVLFACSFVGILVFFFRLLAEIKANQLQNEFLARVSHELRSPVSSLELSSSLLKNGESQDREKLWAIFDSELSRLKLEIEGLIEASRWELKGFRPSLDAVNLEQWIAESSLQWKQILGLGAVLEREGPPLHLVIQSDRRLLNLIANNIVDNSRKFSPDKPRVIIRSAFFEDKGTARWRISFQDFGLGFKPTAAKALFKRFYRYESKQERMPPGTGLGLYIVALAAKALGIKVVAHSDGEGRGATITLEGRL